MHVALAGQAVAIGPAAATESYLLADRVLAAALETGADAIHPGYGFLSENARFAEIVEAHGLTFIGPKPKKTGLARWFAENWKSDRGKYRYTAKSSVYRPTKRVSSKTPVTFSELTRAQILRAKREKARTGHVKVFKR
jgi:hypothetical protein